MPIKPLCILAFTLCLTGCGLLGGIKPYSGRVVDAQGQPIEGAAVASDHAAVLSDRNGRFMLPDAGGRVTVRKPRYQAVEVDPDRNSTVQLKASDAPVTVGWDERWQAPSMEGIKAYLQSHGFAVTTIRSGDLTPHQDVYVLPSPAWFTQDAYASYLHAASEGAKIVVLGEWGGYDGVDFNACNALATKAGLSFASATVRIYGGNPEEFLTLRSITSPTLAASITQGIRMYTAGALDVQAPGVPLVQTGGDGVRIQAWSVGTQTVAAAGALGRASLVALADTSLWTDETGTKGTPHWQTLDNATFAVNVLDY